MISNDILLPTAGLLISPLLLWEITQFMTTPIDEQMVLRDLQKLDAQTIAAIYDTYFPEIYRYVRYRVSEEALAEDLASEVFMRLIESARKGQAPQSSLKGWLIATASHIINDHLRRTYRRPTESLSDALPDVESNVPEQVAVKEQAQAVRSAYGQLTSEQQHVLALRFGQGYSLEETANHLKKNINAVKALQFRALAALQRQLGDGPNE